MPELATNMGQQNADKERINLELSAGAEENITILDLHSLPLSVWNARIKEWTEDTTGDILLLTHSTQGKLNLYKLAGDNHDFPSIDYRVINSHDMFPEQFYNDRFINTGSSTGSWFETDNYYLLEANNVLYTDYIAKEDKAYKSVKIILDAETDAGSEYSYDLESWAIISGSEYQLTNNVDYLLTDNEDTDGIKIKIQNSPITVGVTFALDFPITFGTSETVILKQFEVNYSE